MAAPLKSGIVVRERYKIRRIIGQGGMGSVYLAEDLRLEGRLCAIKEIQHDPNLTEELLQQSRDQFLREATILARLDHPSLPKVSDFFSGDERDFLVMDFVPGEDLRNLLQKARRKGEMLAERLVLSWASQLADALIYLHSQDPSILHRDIKPSNMKVTPTGRLKLVDFGLVKLMAPEEMTITVLQGRGTAIYTPLEQYGGDNGHTDVRSDIYAFGATLYHLLTGEAPKEARDRFLNPGELVPLQEINPELSSRTQRAVLWAMNLHPDNRPHSVKMFREALLGDWKPENIPGPALPTPEIEDVFSTTTERALAVTALGLLLLSLIVTLTHF